MLLSIANASPRNIEGIRSEDLMPQAIAENAKTLIGLVEHYYKYLNTTGLPSAEIGSISTLKDIDLVSAKYLDQIEALIGKSIPHSKVLNKIELYKIIIRYYNSRGSEDSIHTFFKLFFDEVVDIVYPKERLFDLSGNRSLLSDDFMLFDGHYWQDYSYVIRSNLDASEWLDDYKRFVHPSGLKLFTAIAIIMASRNDWEEELNYKSTDVETDTWWMRAFVPPYFKYVDRLGMHTPKFQPGYIRERFYRYLFTYLIPGNFDSAALRLVIIAFKFILGPIDVRNSYIRDQYLASEKFIDPCKIGEGWLDRVIEDTEEEFSNTNKINISNISSFITSTLEVAYSYYDTAGGDASGVWNASSINTVGGTGSGVWSASSYEHV